MTLTIQPVDVNYVQQVWPLVKDYLNDGLHKDDDSPEWSACYTLDHVQQFITGGQWLLLVAADETGHIHGAATVSFANYPIHRIAFITLIGDRKSTRLNSSH